MYSQYAKLRDERGYSDYLVSKKTGISASSLSDWKRGRYQIKLDKIMKLADFFSVPVEELLGAEQEHD